MRFGVAVICLGMLFKFPTGCFIGFGIGLKRNGTFARDLNKMERKDRILMHTAYFSQFFYSLTINPNKFKTFGKGCRRQMFEYVQCVHIDR